MYANVCIKLIYFYKGPISSFQPAIMQRVDGWKMSGGPCTRGSDVNNGYLKCGHADLHSGLIFHMRDIAGSPMIVK